MKIIKKINSLFIILIFVTGCGFKIENNIKKIILVLKKYKLQETIESILK